jgi:hypothetical protein
MPVMTAATIQIGVPTAKSRSQSRLGVVAGTPAVLSATGGS